MLTGLVVLVLACMLLASLAWSQETLLDLTEEQIRGAVAELTEEHLLEIITSAGYKIDETQEKPTREELVEAATVLTLEQKEKMKANGSGATAGDSVDNMKDEAVLEASPTVVEAGEDLEEAHADQVFSQGNAEEEQYDDLDDAPPQAELARKHGLRDDAGFWELFQAQIKSDVGPVLEIIPAPVKAFLADQARHLRPVLVGAMGAAGPMLEVLSKVVNLAGRGLIVASERLEEVSASVKAKHAGEESERVGTSTGLQDSGRGSADVWWTECHEPEVIEL
jgi:hypothetical protein